MTLLLLFIAVIIILCIGASRLSNRLGVPALLVFIVMGMLFGSDGIFKIPFDNYGFAEQICSAALIFIMFYGGFGTNWRMAKPIAAKAIALSTLGVVCTALITAVFCHFILRFGVLESFLIGSVISSTDAASVFSILRSKKLNLKYNTASLLEVESGSNDPASYMLTVTALSLMSGKGGSAVVWMVVSQVVFGLSIGAAVAFLSIWVLKKVKFSVDGFDTLFVLAAALAAYAAASMLGGNGYLSVYVAGIILGNSSIRNKGPLVHFFDGITGLAQIIIFFLLGLLAFPSQIPAILLPSLAVALCLTFIARPISIYLIMKPMKCPKPQMLLVSWAGLRGAASIVFAIMAVVSEAEMSRDLFHIVFCICLLSVTFQGTLLPLFARKTDMVDEEENVLKTFNDYQDEHQMQLIQTLIPDGHPWAGKSIGELHMVADTLIVMVKRQDDILIPRGETVIEAGDLLVLGGNPYRDSGEIRLEEVPIDDKPKWIGKQVKDLKLPPEKLIVILRHKDGKTSIPNGETLLSSGDTMVISAIEK